MTAREKQHKRQSCRTPEGVRTGLGKLPQASARGWPPRKGERRWLQGPGSAESPEVGRVEPCCEAGLKNGRISTGLPAQYSKAAFNPYRPVGDGCFILILQEAREALRGEGGCPQSPASNWPLGFKLSAVSLPQDHVVPNPAGLATGQAVRGGDAKRHRYLGGRGLCLCPLCVPCICAFRVQHTTGAQAFTGLRHAR